jgi:exosome complex RNA-binding protein Rrp4
MPDWHPLDRWLEEQGIRESFDITQVKPIRIRIMLTMNGPIFAVRCRACNMTVAYMADLVYAFESADRHIDRHRRQIEEEMALESQQQTC